MDHKKAIELLEYKLSHALLDEGATYSSIILAAEGNVLATYSSNPHWENIYHGEGLSKDCHLIKASKFLSQKSKDFTVIWDLLPADNEVSLFLNEKRKENKISHGISFCKKNKNGILEVLSLAGRYSEINFAAQVIKNKVKLEKLLAEYKSKYLPKNKMASF